MSFLFSNTIKTCKCDLFPSNEMISGTFRVFSLKMLADNMWCMHHVTDHSQSASKKVEISKEVLISLGNSTFLYRLIIGRLTPERNVGDSWPKLTWDSFHICYNLLTNSHCLNIYSKIPVYNIIRVILRLLCI